MIGNVSFERRRSFLRTVLLAALQLLASVRRFYLVSAAAAGRLIVLPGFNILLRLALNNQTQNETELLHSAGAQCP
jgi:hypothetical protein